MDTPGLDHWGDITVVVLYFVLVMAVGLWSLCRPNRGSVKSFFLAGRDMAWFPVGASLFSSNIGSEHFIGLAGTGAASGIAMIMYEWFSMPLVLCLGWIFLPVYISAGVYTMPEYMEKRFGGKRIRIYLSCLSLMLYIVTKLAVSIYAGALFIKLALAWDMYLSVTGLLLITGIYTILGGLAAVIYTDTFQTVVMTIGALILCVLGFQKIGGYDALQYKYMEAIPAIRANNTTCGVPRDDAFHIFRDALGSDNPWPGLLIQTSLGSLWYWCCDQVIVQRVLAAKNLSHAKAGSILAGYLKLLPLLLMIFPGMISRAMFPDSIGCADPVECEKYCENAVGCSNLAYPKLVLEILPVGLRGLLMAVMLSAIMSSLTSIFNSASTLFTMDLWRRMRPRANERELLIVGRFCVVLLCGVSILWIPMVKSSQGGQLFNYINAVQSYLGTPLTALFLLGVFWKRMNETGAFWGLAIGHICGVIRMAVDFSYPAPGCGEPESRPPVLFYVHFSYYGCIILVITTLGIIIFSLIDKAPTPEQLRGVTYWTRIDKLPVAENNIEEDNLNMSSNGVSDMKSEFQAEDVQNERKGCKYWINFICGMPKSEKHSQDGPEITQKQIREFLYEQPKWMTFMNINAVIGCVIMAFLIGFFY